MNPTILKMAPTAVVLAIGLFLMWPYLGADSAPSSRAAASEAAELTDALLRPHLSPPPARNPFDDPEESRAQLQQSLRQRLNQLVKKIEVARRQVKRSPSGKPGTTTGGDPLSGLTLNATYAGGGRDGAVINGRVFQTGDNVRPESPDEPCVLSQVRQYSVILRCQGRDLELKYAAAAARAGATRSPPPKRARARTASAGSARG